MVLSAGLALLLAAPAAAGRVPTITDTFEEERQRDWTRDPSKKHLPGLVMHLGDLITDRAQRQDDVPGVDFFVDGLQEALRRGSDVPRWRVLRNAKDARDQLRDGYDELRRAVEPLLEARRLLREAGEVLVPAVSGEGEDAERARQAADSVKQAADGIESDPPDARGPEADASAAEPVEPREKELEPVAGLLEKAAKKAEEAKPWAERAKARSKTVELHAERAKELEKEIAAMLGQRRTRGTPTDLDPSFNAEKVIKNANKWLSEAAKRATKVVELLEKQTAPDAGLGKVNALARASDSRNMAAKAAALRSAKRVQGAAKKVLGQLRPEWEAADEKGKREAVEKAAVEERAADEAAAKSAESAEKAESAARAAQAELERAAQTLKKLEDWLGPEPPDDIPDLPELMLDAPEPKLDAKAKGGIGPKVRSKPLRWPKVLDDAPERVILEYGEGR